MNMTLTPAPFHAPASDVPTTEGSWIVPLAACAGVVAVVLVFTAYIVVMRKRRESSLRHRDSLAQYSGLVAREPAT